MIEVIIVEDDPMVRDINSKFLKKVDGFKLVSAVGNLTEAQQVILTKKPDLILLDVYLPKENGIDLLKWLRQNDIQVDVILITADKTSKRVQESFRFGAIDYLIKPFTFERFQNALMLFKERFNSLKNLDDIEQNQIDEFIPSNRLAKSKNDKKTPELIKGFNKYTYNSIWQEIEKINNSYITAEELAEIVGIARVTVRKYLDYMDSEGKLVKIIEYGKIGRPQHKYTIKPD